MPKRNRKGKFTREDGESFGTYVDEKGYPRMSAGPRRGVRVHTLVAEAMLGRKLLKHEDVHHKNEDKTDPSWTNLEVVDHRSHGFISSKQAQRAKRIDEAERRAFEAVFPGSTKEEEYVPF